MMRYFVLLTLFMLATQAYADQCSAVFSQGANSHSASGELWLTSNAQITGGGSTLDIININDFSSLTSCGSANCTSSGNRAGNYTLDAYKYAFGGTSMTISGSLSLSAGTYGTLTISGGASLSLSAGTYRIKSLNLNNNARLNLQAGEYWIETLSALDGAQISVSGSGTVRIYTQNASFNNFASINAAGNPEQLLITSYQNFQVEDSGTVNAIVYASQQLNLGQSTTLTGAVNGADMTLNGTQVTYQPSAISNANFATLCSVGVSTSAYANYQFEQTNWATGDTVLDSSGNLHNGRVLGNLSASIPSAQKSCRAMQVGKNTTFSAIDALDTQIDMNDLGAKGTISFWYRSNENWRSGNIRVLFDASTELGLYDHHFYMRIRNDGSLFFLAEDINSRHISITTTTSYHFTAGEWVHIAATWDMSTASQQIYVNGTLQSVSTASDGGLGYGLASMGSLKIGDNSSSTASFFGESANGYFDDFRTYQHVQDNAAINADMADVTPCAVDDLMAFYQFEQANWATGDPVTDSSNSNQIGQVLGTINAAIPTDQKSCQALEIPYNSSYYTRDAVNSQIDVNDIGDTGTISFWYQSNDNWRSWRNKMLFDASLGLGYVDHHFYLRILPDGSLDFLVEDAASQHVRIISRATYRFDRNDWVHIAVTWDMTRSKLNLYLNGVEQSVIEVIDYRAIGRIAELGQLHIGDNSSESASFSGYSANGRFDDFRVYRNQQTASEILADANNLTPCNADFLVAFYPFEQTNFSGAQSIIDASGNGHNASPVGSISSVLPSPDHSCRAMDVPYNTTSTTYAMDTEIDVNARVGNRGTISFWYKADFRIGDYGRRQLFDASNGSIFPDKFFYLALDGSNLEFGLEDSNDNDLITRLSGVSLPAGAWVHIAATWDMSAKEARIYITYQGSQLSRVNNALILTNTLGDTDTLYFGDSRSNYFFGASNDNSANGIIDEVRIYNYVQSGSEIRADAAATQPCEVLDHILIEHDGQGLTCSAETVSFTACANASCSRQYSQPVSVTLTPSGWINGDSKTLTANSLEQLQKTTPGIVTLGLTGAAYKCLNSSTGSTSCDLEYAEAGFELYGSNIGIAVGDQTAEVEFTDVNLRAVKDSNGVCVAALQGPQTITLGYDCLEPNQCQRPFSGIDGSLATGKTTGSLNVEFDANGHAQLTGLTYADAGKLAISVSATIGGVNYTERVANLVVKPASLHLAKGASFASPPIAGANNPIEVTALGALGAMLPNYRAGDMQVNGQRTQPTSVDHDGEFRFNGLRLSSSLAGSWQNAPLPLFTNGLFEDTQFYYDEVGSLNLQVRDIDYYGYQIDSNVLALENFIPAFLEVTGNSPALQNTHGIFSYIGQALPLNTSPELTIVARNALYQPGVSDPNDDRFITNNYSYANVSANYTFTENTGYPSGQSQFSADPLTRTLLAGGKGLRLTLNNGQLTYLKQVTPTLPFAADFDLTFSNIIDSSLPSLCYQSSYPGSCDDFTFSNISGADLRYGRINLLDTYGPETEPLQVPLLAEYFTANGWQLNIDDSSTAIDWSTTAGSLSLTPIGSPDITALIGAITSSGTLQSGMGDSNDLLLSAPGVGNQGQLLLTLLTGYPWADYLNIDWDGDGDIDANDTPSAAISFGLYRGNDRVIHWREVFQ